MILFHYKNVVIVNHSARMGELITLNENIAIISKLKKNRKKNNIYSIHKKLIKSSSSFQDLDKEDRFTKVQDLVAERQVVNKINQNNDSFEVNKDS